MLGHVFWISGLSGAGKTTVGSALASILRERNVSPILLDGDDLRLALSSLIPPEAPYTYPTRERLGLAYSRLAKLLLMQGVTVIVATISMFDSVQKENRKMRPNYTEVFLEVPLKVLRVRDSKGLYRDGSAYLPDPEARRGLPDNRSLAPHLTLRNLSGNTPDAASRAIIDFYDQRHR